MRKEEVRAITLYQPYAQLLAVGAKKFETRSWSTSYRGSIAIHAGKKHVDARRYSNDHLHKFAEGLDLPMTYNFDGLPYGAVIATAELTNCYEIIASAGCELSGMSSVMINTADGIYIPTEEELLFGDWQIGRYAWEFANINMLSEPVPAKGYQRLWKWEPVCESA